MWGLRLVRTGRVGRCCFDMDIRLKLRPFFVAMHQQTILIVPRSLLRQSPYDIVSAKLFTPIHVLHRIKVEDPVKAQLNK